MVQLIKEVLSNYLNKEIGMSRVLDEQKIENAWAKINNKSVVENTTPERLIGGTLYLSVSNSVWAQQVSMMKADILAALNSALGGKAVQDIRTRTGLPEKKADEKHERIKIVCIACGVEFGGKGTLCPICSREKKQSALKSLYRMVSRNPKATYKEAKGEIPGIDDVDFRRVKRDLNALVVDKKERERRNRGREKNK